jgi:hypothetical protein
MGAGRRTVWSWRGRATGQIAVATENEGGDVRSAGGEGGDVSDCSCNYKTGAETTYSLEVGGMRCSQLSL